MPEHEFEPLRLRATDTGDLSVIAAMLQDALAPIGDIGFMADEGSFMMALNRFRWEAEDEDAKRHERVHAGLRFDTVRRVQYRGIDLADRGRFLELLTISYDEGVAVLHFAGGSAIRLEVERLECALGDFEEPWPTAWKPAHEVD